MFNDYYAIMESINIEYIAPVNPVVNVTYWDFDDDDGN
jgi:hypothetical protein